MADKASNKVFYPELEKALRDALGPRYYTEYTNSRTGLFMNLLLAQQYRVDDDVMEIAQEVLSETDQADISWSVISGFVNGTPLRERADDRVVDDALEWITSLETASTYDSGISRAVRDRDARLKETAVQSLREQQEQNAANPSTNGGNDGNGPGRGSPPSTNGGVDTQYQPPESDWFGIPPDGEVWKIDGKYAVAYRSDLGGPYIYYTMDDDRFNDVFPQGAAKVREVNQREADRLGVTPGSSYLLDNTLGKNWEEGFNRGLEIQTRTSPWLEDGEVVATVLAATLEGREITKADLEGTTYFSGRSDSEVQYVAFSAQATPGELDQYHSEYKDTIRNQLVEAGMRQPNETVVNFMAQKWASGQWTDGFASRQIVALANPFSSVEVDEELNDLTGGMEFDTLGTRSRQVEQMVTDWLGPHHSKSYSAEWYKQWAGSIADDPNAENDLIEVLQQQRMSLYPEYSNKNLKYADIAGPWENQMRTVWGRTPGSQNDYAVLDRVIRSNDVNNAGKILREEGLNMGVGNVVNNMSTGANSAFGGQVVRGN